MGLRYAISNHLELKICNLFNEETLLLNYYKMDNYLQKKLELNDEIDERCFLKTRKSLTPVKFTPFHKQGELNKFASDNFSSKELEKKRPGSSRMLNYEMTMTINKESKLNEFVFYKKKLIKFDHFDNFC